MPFSHRPLVAAVLAAAALVAGCGDDGQTEKPMKIGFIPMQLGNPAESFFATSVAGAEEKAKELGVELLVRAPSNWGVDEQIAFVDELIQAEVGAIAISPLDNQQLIEPLRRAHERGIVVVTFNSAIGDGNYENGSVTFPAAFITSNNTEGGKICCEAMAAKMGGAGKVYIQDHITGISALDERVNGCTEVHAQEYPDIEIVGREFHEGDVETAQQQVADMLATNADLKGVFAINLVAGLGAARALDEAGLAEQVVVASYDAPVACIDSLKAGGIDLCLAQKPGQMGATAIDFAVQALLGVAGIPKETFTGFVPIDSTNFDDAAVAQFIYADTGS